MKVQKFTVWADDGGPFDPEAPGAEYEAFSPDGAAESFAERRGRGESEVYCIVRDTEGKYYECELIRVWELDLFNQVTVAELTSEGRLKT